MPFLRRQRGSPSVARAGLQPGQFHADAGDANQPAGEIDQDRRQDGSYGRYVTFQMAEVAVPRQMFDEVNASLTAGYLDRANLQAAV
jgi:hypothetical protein